MQVNLDAHARPPEALRLLMKRWQRCALPEIDGAEDIVDTQKGPASTKQHIEIHSLLDPTLLSSAFSEFMGKDVMEQQALSNGPYYCLEMKALPGLFVFPSLFPPLVQAHLLDRLLHRDLSSMTHRTNLDLHYERPSCSMQAGSSHEPSPTSFFELDHDAILSPKDDSIHKPITVEQMLNRKLRWMTLGGQYDWTAKVYPTETAPAFPSDVGRLLHGIWPAVDAQAAIVNFYTPGDTLSVHRDVSEECDRGLISVSIGCDALFIAGNEDGSSTTTIRLHSGDAVLMSGTARYAWHAVPKVIPNTCPPELASWPHSAGRDHFASWSDWLQHKRINLNVRQMRLTS